MNIRVLHITRDFPPGGNGGLSTAVAGLVNAIASRGVQNRVVSFDGYRPNTSATSSQKGEEPNGYIYRIRNDRDLGGAKQWCAHQECTLLHLHDAWGMTLAEQLKAALRLPVLFTPHVYHRHQNALRGLDATQSEVHEQRALSVADAVTAVSTDMRERLEDRNLNKPIYDTPLGVEVFPTAPTLKKRFIYAGRFADIKGTAETINAFGKFALARADYECVLLGGNPENARSTRGWLKRIEALALPNVRFMPWNSDRIQVRQFIAESTALIAPSWFETFGQSVAEALVSGVPVIASQEGGLRDRFTPGVDGIAVPTKSAAPIVEAMKQMVTPPWQERRPDIARRHTEDLWERCAASWVQLYKDTLTREFP